MIDWEKKRIVENASQGRWSAYTELRGIQNKINENNSSTPNPSKAPLNYIDNMDNRKKYQKEYEKQMVKNQYMIAAILQAAENKTEEINRFREEKATIDVEIQKIIWSLCRKLNPYADFLNEVVDEINNWMQNNQDQEEYTYQQNEFEQQEVEDDNYNDEYSALWQGNEQFTQSILQVYFQIADEDSRKIYKLLLDKAHVEWIENLMDWVKDLEEKYKELQCQSYSLSEKIENLENELSDIDTNYIKCENDKKYLDEEKYKRDETYFLDSYKSTKDASFDDFIATPMVKEQIKYILNLYKKWLPIPKTILLCWEHGLWKTYTANVLSSELWLPMYHIKSYDIFNSEYQDPAEMLNAIFNIAIRKNEPCIIFLDEMEKFSSGSEWSPYQTFLENTLRHHISKIKESNREIIIIWAVSEWWKLDPNLLKQDVFSKQIIFEEYWKEECKDLLQKILDKKGLKLWYDIDLDCVVSKIPQRNPAYIKFLIDIAEECLLSYREDPEFSKDLEVWYTILEADIEKAIELIKNRNRFSIDHIWY